MPSSDFLTEAKARGYVFQCTDEAALDEALLANKVSAYIGFDPTASSLHVGSMVQIMMLRLLQKHGHKPVALMGGGTTKIGDPSFREEARQLLTDETIAENIAGIRRNIEPFLTFGDGPSDADHGEQCRLARPARLYRVAARNRACISASTACSSFDSVKSAAGARAGADLPRIQLHRSCRATISAS